MTKIGKEIRKYKYKFVPLNDIIDINHPLKRDLESYKYIVDIDIFMK